MLEKSRNFAHDPEVAKITSDMGFKVGVAKWLDSATYTLSTECASSYFHVQYENRYTHVTHQYLQKVSEAKSQKPNRKLVIFN